MHRYGRLETLSTSGVRKFRRLGEHAERLRSSTALSPHEIESEAAALTIGLQTAWANCIKWYLVSCMLGARTARGKLVQAAFSPADEDAAVGVAVVAWRPKAHKLPTGSWDPRDEPPWHKPAEVVHIAKVSQLSHRGDVASAFSAGYAVFDDLPRFRNYFAHRNLDTRRAAMDRAPSYGVGTTQKPSEVIRALAPGYPVCVLQLWAEQLARTLEYLCG